MSCSHSGQEYIGGASSPVSVWKLGSVRVVCCGRSKDLAQSAQRKSGEHRAGGRVPYLWPAGFGRLETKAPTSLRKITQGRMDDDTFRIVREARSANGLGNSLKNSCIISCSGSAKLRLRRRICRPTRQDNSFRLKWRGAFCRREPLRRNGI